MLEVQQLIVEHGRLRALWGVDLQVGAGEVVALVGMDGAGKSTTLGAVAGFHPWIGGSVRFDGQSLARLSVPEIVSRGIVLVPEGRRLWPDMTVRENLEMGAYLPKPRRDLKRNLQRVFSLFPALSEKQSNRAADLSGGQQAMVAIGRALMAEPRLLLLDEPFIGMSPLIVQEVKNALMQARAAVGMAVLIVDQDFRRAMGVSDRMVVIENGRSVLQGSPLDLNGNEEFACRFLGLRAAVRA